VSKENAYVLQEQNILSLCLQNPNLLYEVDERYFLSSAAKKIYSAIKELRDNDIDISERILYTEVQKTSNIGNDIIKNLFNLEGINKKDFNTLYQSLKKQWLKTSTQNYLLEDMLSYVSQKGEIDIDKISEFRKQIDDNLKLIGGDNSHVYTLSQMFDVYEKELDRREAGNFFYDTGCSYLNENLTVGFAPQFMSTLFAQSGVGKSTYALNLINKQINKQIPSIYFSPEMPLIATMDRLIAQRLKVPLRLLYPSLEETEESIGLNENIRSRIEKERQKLETLPYFRFVEEESLYISDLELIIEQTKKAMGVDYLIATVDLLTMIKDFNIGRGSKAELYENAMNSLHEMVRRQNIHLLGVVQSKRPNSKVVINEVDDIERLRPGIEEIKNSSGMEERSRIVIAAFRKKYFAQKYLPEDPETELLDDILDITILKQNLGNLANLKYLFNGESAFISRLVEDDLP